MTPQTIDDVLDSLDQLIRKAREEKSRLGYFAALYRNVTLNVKEGIASGLFDDGERMERLDVTFANRYLSAFDCFRRGEPCSKCWLGCFRLSASWSPIILQHLLTGINAHINFDLGIAAQAVAPGAELASLKNDFETINGILGGMIVKARSNIEEVSPWIKLLDRVNPRGEDALVKFSLDKARTSAWLVANLVNETPSARLSRELSILDDGVSILGNLIGSPREWLLRFGLYVIRVRESNDVPHIIDVLSQV